ncbi:hypothetical protein EMIT0347P_90126 [Pseudomonas sp. IT-347P]
MLAADNFAVKVKALFNLSKYSKVQLIAYEV